MSKASKQGFAIGLTFLAVVLFLSYHAAKREILRVEAEREAVYRTWIHFHPECQGMTREQFDTLRWAKLLPGQSLPKYKF